MVNIKDFKKVNIGDLVIFEEPCNSSGRWGAGFLPENLVGFVMTYTNKYTILSNTGAKKPDGSYRKPGFGDRRACEKQTKAYFDDWGSYRILEKYSPKSKDCGLEIGA